MIFGDKHSVSSPDFPADSTSSLVAEFDCCDSIEEKRWERGSGEWEMAGCDAGELGGNEVEGKVLVEERDEAVSGEKEEDEEEKDDDDGEGERCVLGGERVRVDTEGERDEEREERVEKEED